MFLQIMLGHTQEYRYDRLQSRMDSIEEQIKLLFSSGMASVLSSAIHSAKASQPAAVSYFIS